MTRPTPRPIKVPLRWMLLAALWAYYGVGALLIHSVPPLLVVATIALAAWELRGRFPSLPPNVRRHMPFAIFVAVAVLFIVAMMLAPTAADQYKECFVSEAPPSNPKACEGILDTLSD
jgi:heme/copper-type cytochrome/quinol oxidase subunit 2